LEGTPYSYQQTPCFRLHRAFRNPSKSRVRGAGGLAPLGIEGSGVHGSLSLQSPGSWGASPPRDRGVGVHGSLSPPILRFLPPVALSPLPLLLPAVVRQSYGSRTAVSLWHVSSACKSRWECAPRGPRYGAPRGPRLAGKCDHGRRVHTRRDGVLPIAAGAPGRNRFTRVF